jgi:Asp-tRNA(Asn)/Glu-tRNA(Gln) amidotransferase A subunit family amidase
VQMWQWTAAQIVGRVRSRDVSIMQVVQAFVDRIERTKPTINAIVTFTPERALAAAAAADRRLAVGGQVRPLERVPFTVKDVIPTDGVRTTYGSPIFENFVPDEDAIAVQRLKVNGAILVGKSSRPIVPPDDPSSGRRLGRREHCGPQTGIWTRT